MVFDVIPRFGVACHGVTVAVLLQVLCVGSFGRIGSFGRKATSTNHSRKFSNLS